VRISDPARQIWEQFLRILSPVLVRMVYNHSALYVSIWAHGVHRIHISHPPPYSYSSGDRILYQVESGREGELPLEEGRGGRAPPSNSLDSTVERPISSGQSVESYKSRAQSRTQPRSTVGSLTSLSGSRSEQQIGSYPDSSPVSHRSQPTHRIIHPCPDTSQSFDRIARSAMTLPSPVCMRHF
jgi:hypothetical protein